MSTTSSLPEPVLDLLPLFPQDIRIWLVGGAVRDILLDRETSDFDFAVEGDALDIARRIANGRGGVYYTLDREREIGRAILSAVGNMRITFDVSRLRGGTIEADLSGRDFTANALAIKLESPYEWIDPLNGVKDIKERVLRPCSPEAILDDPIRSLRAVRLSVELSFRMAKETIQQIRQTPPFIQAVSSERVRDEIMLVLDMPSPGKGVRLLDHMQLLSRVFPELKTSQDDPHLETGMRTGIDYTLTLLDRLGDLLAILADVYNPDQTGNVILAQASLRLGRYREQLMVHLGRSLSQGRRARQILFLAALYQRAGAIRALIEGVEESEQDSSGSAAGLVGARAHQLRLSNAEADLATNIVRCHRAPEGIDESRPFDPKAIYRYFRSTREVGVEVVLLWLADFLAASGAAVSQSDWAAKLDLARALLQAYFEEKERFVDPPPLVDGSDLMRILQLDPGPQVGRLLELVREAQVAGEVNTREQAVAFLHAISDEELNSSMDRQDS